MVGTALRTMTALFLSASILSPAIADDAFVGQVVSITGKVLVRMETKATQITFVKAGDKLQKGSILNTSSNGSAKLMMTDKTIIDLGPSSLFKVNDYDLKNTADRKVDLSVDYGTIRASVNQKVNPDKGKFTIRTKAATMGVRGTEFVVNAGTPEAVKAGKAETSLTVMHGQVEVKDFKNPAPVKVDGGMQFVKAEQGVAQVQKLDPAKIALVRSEAFVTDTTFIKSVSIDSSTSQASESERSESAKENRKNGEAIPEKAAEKTAEKTGEKGGEKGPTSGGTGPGAGGPPPPPPSGNLAMMTLVQNVNLSATTMPAIDPTSLALPGMLPPPTTVPNTTQPLQGLPKSLKVIFNP